MGGWNPPGGRTGLQRCSATASDASSRVRLETLVVWGELARGHVDGGPRDRVVPGELDGVGAQRDRLVERCRQVADPLRDRCLDADRCTERLEVAIQGWVVTAQRRRAQRVVLEDAPWTQHLPAVVHQRLRVRL